MRGELCALVLALLATFAPARAGEQSVVIDDVRVTASTWWPDGLNHGWQPVTIEVANDSRDDVAFDLRLHGGGGATSDIVTRPVRVKSGERERFELVLPARPSMSNAYQLVYRVSSTGTIGGVGAQLAIPPTERVVLVASRSEPASVDVARWATDLSTESEPRVPADAGNRARLGGLGYVHLPPPRVSSGAPAATVPPNVRVGGIAFDNLSALPDAYTSLHALVLDVGTGAPPSRAALDAITSWTRSGGVLAVTGAGAGDFVLREPALAAWVEPRFAVDATTSVCGLGLLLVLEGAGALASPGAAAALNAAIEARAPLDGPAPRTSYAEVPDIHVPVRPLTLLLVLFAILVGPVNLILVRRTGKPALLLLTIPAIALFFSIGLVVYGAVAQGLDVRATSSSAGVLDQRTHHGSSHERRQVFAGLAAGPGIRPGPGVVVERPPDNVYDYRDRKEYRAEFDEERTLSGSWLPVRTPTRFTVSTDRAARGRIEVERVAEGWRATNGLEADVQQLVFRDADGEMHAFSGPIVPGRSAIATGAPDEHDLERLEAVRVLATALEDGSFLPRNAWIARVASSPLLDPCGIEYDERIGDHVVLGVLASPERR